MSEVVPLPSFGEVFFDARGQDRVLRVTWHDGTLVLSLWRGEMCTASFRMPMEDVGRLIDTLDEGFTEAGGEHAQDAGTGPFPMPDEGYPAQDGYPPQTGYDGYPAQDGYPVPEGYPAQDGYAAREVYPAHDGYPDYPDYPGTGQYARPPVPVPAPTPAPNDVLVARGAPVQDRLVASSLPQPMPQPVPQPVPQPAAVDVDPNDPLGLGQVRPYVQQPMYTTGERLRPEERPEHWQEHRPEEWDDARGW